MHELANAAGILVTALIIAMACNLVGYIKRRRWPYA